MKAKGIIFLILREFVTGFVITIKEHINEITKIISQNFTVVTDPLATGF